MYKRRFIFVLICLLSLAAGSQNLSAQSQLAQNTYAILEASCLNCHGPDGAFRETLLMEYGEIIDGGSVIPGNPNASELYKRLLGPTENGVRMPFGLPQLPAQSIETVRRWILEGAPDWAAVDTPERRFITPGETLTSIETHLNSLASFDRSFARYFTMTHLYNAGETSAVLGEYRTALYKLVNSLSWGSEIINPQPIDPQATIFHIDLRHYEWDVNDAWTTIEEVYPYHIAFDAPAHLALKNQLGRLQTQMKTDVPSVHVDWFIANASTPPLYHDLLSLPLTDRELETRLEVDVARNIINAPGVRVWRAGFNNSGVSNHNRVVERHTSRYGAYWKSYDFAGSVGTQNIFTHPTAFTPDGGEVVFNLPNGLQGYFVTNASGFRLDEAPINIVSNPAASDPTVRNGISCFGCHTEGMKIFEDQVRSVIESNANPPYDKAQALRLYVEKPDMDTLVEKDMETYGIALEATGGAVGGVEPISRFHEAFQAPVDAAYAAAVVGLRTETFLARVRENTGLQNVGLLALDNANGSVKRDTWTSSFRDIMSALDYPDQVGEPPVTTQPDVLPGGQVHFPDPNLRAAVAEALGKSANAPITVEEMGTLSELRALDRGIQDLTGLRFATSLSRLQLGHWNGEGNQVSDLSPIAGLTELRHLILNHNLISDLSPLAGLTNLKFLSLEFNDVSDLSPLEGLINLEHIDINVNEVSDLSPLARLVNLRYIRTWGNPISDLSPLAGLTKLGWLNICGAKLQDASLAPLAGLVSLKELYLVSNGISDISPIGRLTGLERLDFRDNQISDISALAGLTNLKWLGVDDNNITNFSPLDSLRANTKIVWHNNPGFPTGGPKIEGPWLWAFLPDVRPDSGVDLLADATGGAVTEMGISTHGATLGQPVGDDEWTSHNLPPTGWDNISDMLGSEVPTGVIYGNLSLYSSRRQNTTLYVGAEHGVKVWLNGVLIRENRARRAVDYSDFFPVTLQQGRNVLLVAVRTEFEHWVGSNAFFGFEDNAEYTVATGIGYAFSDTPIHIGDTFTFDVRAENVSDMAGWQFDIAFDPAILGALDISEGDFLKTEGGTTFFQSGRIDNAAGKITGLNTARLEDHGASGSGTILQVRFKAKSEGATRLALQNFVFGTSTGENIPAGPHEIYLTVKQRLVTGDVNRDGVVNVLDLILVARQLGKRLPPNSPEDINGDGVVNIFDLTLVAQGIGGAAAPPAHGLDSRTIEAWISLARIADDGSLAFRQAIANLQNLLASMIPEKSALLPNYPNPFNPETWIPYQLATPSDVTLTIYDMHGGAVRRLEMGHRAAGIYQHRNRALYWDGRNGDGESVASGIYFYTLTAGDFTATRKMLIRK